MRKKEPKELIEILLRQQRANRPGEIEPRGAAPAERRPGEADPFEGIEWGGLPDELRDRVYRPPQPREALVELLASVGEKQEANPPSQEPPPEQIEAPPQPEHALPARPAWHQRLSAWFFDFFGILNRTYEVRVATMIAFTAGAAFFASLCFLLGTARGRSSVPFYDARRSAEHASIVSPTATRPAEVRNGARQPAPPPPKPTEKPPPVDPAPGKKPSAPPPKPTGPWQVIGVTAVKTEKAAEKIRQYLRENGLADHDPRYYPSNGNWTVVLGRWTLVEEANTALKELKRVRFFETMNSKGVISNLDQYVTRSER